MEQFINIYTLAAIIGVLIVSNIVCFILINRLRSHYNSLTKDITKKTLTAALEGIQKTLATHERSLVVYKKDLAETQKHAKSHLQNLILKRFNPFSDTGGDQSFLLGLLDGNKDGVVITSLHSRENTRFYIKSVKGGQGEGHPLSREEQKLISK